MPTKLIDSVKEEFPFEYKCSFCKTITRHLDKKAKSKGWGRILCEIKNRHVNIIYCPEHAGEAILTFLDCALVFTAANEQS